MHPVMLELELVCMVWDVEIVWLHVRSHDNSRADLQSRSWDAGFVPEELRASLQQLEEEADRQFPIKPRRCAPARPDLVQLLAKHTASMDAFGQGGMTEEEREEYDALVPLYQQLGGARRAVGRQFVDGEEREEVQEWQEEAVRWSAAHKANRSWPEPNRSAMAIEQGKAKRARGAGAGGYAGQCDRSGEGELG